MKSYTDLERSKKLAEILPLESADMYYDYDVQKHEYYPMIMDEQFDDTCIPAWSSTALMNILDRGALFKTPQGWVSQTYIEYEAITSNYYSNSVDAAFEIVVWLKENEKI